MSRHGVVAPQVPGAALPGAAKVIHQNVVADVTPAQADGVIAVDAAQNRRDLVGAVVITADGVVHHGRLDGASSDGPPHPGFIRTPVGAAVNRHGFPCRSHVGPLRAGLGGFGVFVCVGFPVASVRACGGGRGGTGLSLAVLGQGVFLVSHPAARINHLEFRSDGFARTRAHQRNLGARSIGNHPAGGGIGLGVFAGFEFVANGFPVAPRFAAQIAPQRQHRLGTLGGPLRRDQGDVGVDVNGRNHFCAAAQVQGGDGAVFDGQAAG